MCTKSVFEDALQLRPAERLQLIELLSRSLNKPDENVVKIWVKKQKKDTKP